MAGAPPNSWLRVSLGGTLFCRKNKPATFIYPAWSLIADFKMWWLWLTGDLKIELEKAGVPES